MWVGRPTEPDWIWKDFSSIYEDVPDLERFFVNKRPKHILV